MTVAIYTISSSLHRELMPHASTETFIRDIENQILSGELKIGDKLPSEREMVEKMGYDTVAILGNPENYACYGFKNCKRYNVYVGDNEYLVALMVKTLKENVLDGKSWKYIESPAHNPDMSGFDEFDSTFEHMEKGYKKSQELFWIYCRSNVIR